MATINNTLSNTLLSGTGGKDTINNGDYLSNIYSGTRKEGGDSVTMAGGAGNDHISNCYGYNVSITGDAGKDEIYNYYGDDATIAGGAGKDYIANGVSDDISLSGGADNDTIFNLNGDRATIDGGEGNDSIENTYGNSVSIDGGEGNDYIGNSYGLGYEGLKVTINGGEGNDTISNGSDKVSINGGDGDDSISNSGADVTIDAGAGNDSISLNSTGNLIQYKSGDGSDTIWGFNESDTLTITGSSYSTQVSGDDVIVTVGKDKILLVGAKGKSLNINKKGTAKLITLTEKKDGYRFSNRLEGVKIDALGGNDNIVNYYSNVTIDGGAGNDWIENYWGDSVALDGGTGNDYINNYAANVTINGGNGNDNIDNSYEGDSVSIDGGAGKDSIYNDGSSVTIDGGTGNDYIRNEGGHNVSINGGAGSDNIVIGGLYYALSQVTITGGAGHDSINLQSSGNLIEYTAGDGNDTIWGFNESDTLTITGGSYSTEVSGDDVIVTVGEGQILLVGAKGKSLNINKESTTKIITLTENADTYSNSFKGVKIDALGGKDYIYNFGDKVTIDSGTGYQNVITNRDGDSVSISGGAGDDNIYNYANSKTTINAGKGNDFIRFWSTGNLVQYNAGDGNDTIWGFNESDTLTITGGSYSTQVSGDDVIVKVGKGSVLLKNAKDKSLNINKEGTTKLITYDTGQETFYNLFKGVTISVRNHSDYGNYINHSIYNYGDKVTISGSERREGISNYGSNVKINTGASDDYVYNYASKVTIDFGDDADTFYNDKGSNLSINGGAGCDRIYNGGENYNGGDNVTINGGKGNDFISLGSDALNNLIQYKFGDGNDIIKGFRADSTLSISGGEYSTAKSGSDIIVTVGDGKIKLFDAASLSAVNIIDAKTSANSWKLSGTMATYGTSSKTLVKVTGVKSLDGLSLSGKIVTVAASSLNKKKVSISGSGYTLALADDVTTPMTKKAAWAYKSGTATYKSSYKTAGYSLANNGKSISYLKATTAEGLATINGAKSKSFTVSGNKITLKNSALKNKVTVGGGYDFNFASDYKNATITGSANDDTITTNGNNLSVNGGEGDDTLKIFGTGTTVTGGDGSDVFIFKAGNNVIADYSEEDLISITGAAQVSTSGDDVIFSVGNGKVTVTGGADKTISYTDASGKQTYSASSSAVSINGKTIVLLEDYTEDSFNVADYGEKLQTIDASAVQLDLEIIGNKLRNSIKGGENNETLIGGKGNDTLTGGEGSDVFIYNSGDGNDLITDYNEDDIINFASGTASVTKKNKDVIFKVGSGKITVAGAASKTVTYIDADGKTNYYPTTPAESIIWKDSNKTAILRETYSETTFTASDHNASIKTIDASSVTHNIKITGNGKANQILGGYENDTINGGKGNDTLQGGSGADVFVYSNGDGKDIILDYAEEDRIQIKSGTAKVATNGNDVIFTIGSGKISVLGAVGKTISYVEGGKTKTYGGSASNILEDDNFITSNDLSSLVQSKAADYSFAEFETSLNSAKALPSVTYSSKK